MSRTRVRSRRGTRNLTLLLLACALCLAPLVQGQTDVDIARISQSPYEIERFVEQTPAFHWEPLWKALHIETDSEFGLPPCEEPSDGMRACAAELLVISKPEQVVLTLRHHDSMFEVYLRFVPVRSGDRTTWRLTGRYQPFVKYFPPHHRIVEIGNSPWLVVTGQGGAGTCFSSEVEAWIDLTARDLEPVFSLTKQGHKCGSRIPNREVQGDLISFRTHPVRSVTITYQTSFSAVIDNDLTMRIGGRGDTIVYVWKQGAGFQQDDAQSTLPTKEVEALYGDLIDDPSPEQFLRYDLENLKRIAAGPEGVRKRWLRSFLRNCSQTSERRVLEDTLLANKTR